MHVQSRVQCFRASERAFGFGPLALLGAFAVRLRCAVASNASSTRGTVTELQPTFCTPPSTCFPKSRKRRSGRAVVENPEPRHRVPSRRKGAVPQHPLLDMKQHDPLGKVAELRECGRERGCGRSGRGACTDRRVEINLPYPTANHGALGSARPRQLMPWLQNVRIGSTR